MSLWYQVTPCNRFSQDIQDRKDDFHSMASSEAVTETTPKTDFLFFFIYYLKKRKCSITSHTEMYCLRKKYIYIFHIFLLFFSPIFSSFFGNVLSYSTRNKTFFLFFFFFKSGTSVGRSRVPTSVSPNHKTKQTNKKCTKKYVIHSYHFGFIN